MNLYGIAWYAINMGTIEPKGLFHFAKIDGSLTLCGKKLNEKWFFIPNEDNLIYNVNCPKCLKIIEKKNKN
jgi:hypothetical protein